MGEKRRQGKAQEERSEGGWRRLVSRLVKESRGTKLASREISAPPRIWNTGLSAIASLTGTGSIFFNRTSFREIAASPIFQFRESLSVRFTLFNLGQKRISNSPGEREFLTNVGCRKVNRTIEQKCENSKNRMNAREGEECEKFRSLRSIMYRFFSIGKNREQIRLHF